MAIEMLALFIPIISIFLGVAIAIVWIITSHRQKIQRNEMRHKERLAAVEKGLDILPETPEPEVVRKSGSLRSGLVGVFVGIVLYFALRAVADPDIALFGLIPAAVGLANLLSYFLERKSNGNGKRDA